MNKRGVGIISVVVLVVLALAGGVFLGNNIGNDDDAPQLAPKNRDPRVNPDLPGGGDQCRGDIDGDGDVDTDDLNIIIMNEGCGGGALLCYDTDVTQEYPNGVNPFEKGTVLNESGSFTDYCLIGGTRLREHFCSEEAAFSNIECLDFGSYTCIDGACVFFDATLPDLNLSIHTVQITPYNLTGNETTFANISVTAGVGNIGGSTTPETTTRFFLFGKPPIFRPTAPLEPGVSITQQVEFTEVMEGTHTIVVTADYYNQTEEISEENNEDIRTIVVA